MLSRQSIISFLATLSVVLAALWLGRSLWVNYMESPWTRDGRVRAEVVTVAPDVAGLVLEVPVRDNQAVKKGDLLLRIDPARFELAVQEARALLAARQASLAMRELNAKRRLALDEQVVSREDRDDASNAAARARAEYQQAQALLEVAELNLRRTRVLAPVDGYVTNLSVYPGDYAHAGEAQLAVVDRHSYWVYGYFEETKLPLLKVGDAVEMQLMSGQLLEGRIESIARAIYDRDNPQSRELIADVNPTFNWVRLAQRVPVRISIDRVPDGVLLAAGITCTVVVKPRATDAAGAAAQAQ
ncbi:RND family efflux transporter, MFP subunit [Geopseudomonas sagittaria]|uniref:RND family efflux transporter, MFP subunit n=1 Tax=Geopseudomonas sagittaria TaxID=1135990 RepID=A0A1I5STS0_9GAMM|nr:HlyD family secretion protein [Pseudomonas sagittaria]MCM2332176.1 HlyD family secretion protein [Pseudomonas sagittaria]SFP74139.1 RND family efflux transporter, MFP subunit [Pseudomonas sagittaria]